MAGATTASVSTLRPDASETELWRVVSTEVEKWRTCSGTGPGSSAVQISPVWSSTNATCAAPRASSASATAPATRRGSDPAPTVRRSQPSSSRRAISTPPAEGFGQAITGWPSGPIARAGPGPAASSGITATVWSTIRRPRGSRG